jgi:predicted nucleic acid-binding protein
VITLDTSAVVALLVRDLPHHTSAVRALEGAGQPVVVPLGILSDIDDALTEHLPPTATLSLLEGIQRGDTLLDCGDLDLPRIRELMIRYQDPPLRFSDAAVVACAERNGGSVLSFERRALDVVARQIPITLLP